MSFEQAPSEPSKSALPAGQIDRLVRFFTILINVDMRQKKKTVPVTNPDQPFTT